MDSQLVTLKNGLRVVIIDTKTFPSLTALLLVAAGSRYENKENNGVAHFFEHMAFKGSKKYPNALAISTLLDGLGSEHNAFTAKDHTGYWIKAPTKHFSTVVDVLSEMILNPLLTEEEINREKGVIVEEINMYEDQPQYKVWDLFEGLLYPDSPLGYDTVGRKDSVTKFTRQTFLDYMGNFYSPKNSVIVIAGGLGLNSTDPVTGFLPVGAHLDRIKKVGSLKTRNKDYLQSKMATLTNLRAAESPSTRATRRILPNYLEVIEEKFNIWKKENTNSFLEFEEKQTKPAILVYPKKTEQAHLVLGFRGLNKNDPDRYVQTVLMALLGGGMSSRLFYEVRERRGLCYYIQSGAETFNDTGYVFTRAGLNIDVKKINEAIKLIVNEHEKIALAKLDEKELNKTKEMLKGRLILSIEDSNNLASFVGKKLMFENKLVTPEQIIKRIDQVAKNQIVDLAKKLFNKGKFNLAVIGPINQDQFRGENYF